MQKFIISVKSKTTGCDAIPPYIVNSLDGLGKYSERVSSMGLIVIVDSIKEENNFIELKSQVYKGDNVFGPQICEEENELKSQC